MKAAVVLGPNQTPIYGEFDEPTPQDGLVVIRVAASALSNATRARAAGGHYSLTGGFPLVPGIDGVGRTARGERVGFLLPEAPFGGMAEKTLVRDALCLPVPDNLGDVLAAAIINPGQSPIGALRARATLQPGEGVLVNGATGTTGQIAVQIARHLGAGRVNGATGTTGQIAVQIARHLGAGRVVATGRNPDALARLRALGADATIALTGDVDAVRDALAAHFADGGIDVVLDYLSGPPTELVLGAIARSHKAAKTIRYVIAGGAAGAATSVPTGVLGSTSLVLLGYGIGSARLPEIVSSAREALQLAGSANLRIDLTAVPLAQVAEAWATDHDRSRVVFTI